jgi:nucleotide-binding universal stress UspA family protein
MPKFLVAVDGSEHSERTLRHVVELAPMLRELRVRLVTVEPKPVDWQMHGMERDAALAHLKALGERRLESARAILDAAGITYEATVELGEPAETIVRVAAEAGCDQIVMGTRGLGTVRSLVLGSVATKVVHLAGVPVTLVK